MKKITALLLALMMLAGVLAGCGKPQDTGKAGKLKVVTTIFPEYDWVRAILGDKADNAEVTMLLDNGVDLHSYQPTADDIVKILGLGDNIKEFLGTDRGLDFINDFKRDHPGIDVFPNKGMIREVIKD